MQISNRVKVLATGVVSTAGFAASYLFAKADYTTSTLSTALGAVLDTNVQAIINTFVNFLTNNLPLIVILGVSVSIVFWLIAKARRAGHGG